MNSIYDIKPEMLEPHPINEEIYKDTYDNELLESIRAEGILTPLKATQDGYIISGNRRHAAAKKLKLKSVPVIYSRETDGLRIEKEIIESNRQREKTNEQKAREYRHLKEIETKLAKQRQEATLKQNQDPVPENFPERESKGDARDKAAETIGMSGRSAENASKVVDVADKLKEEGQEEEAEELVDTLNKSVSGAYKKAKPYLEESQQPQEDAKEHKHQFNQTNDNIEWAKWTWNPVTGCKHGCKFCYARDIANRFYEHGFEPKFYPERLAGPENTKVPNKEGIGWKNVFVSSMGDLFGDWVEQDWIDQVMEACSKNQQWNFLFLTKNPKRLLDVAWPVNAWVGATVDCQARVEQAEDTFRKLSEQDNRPTVTFISCEPLQEQIDIDLSNIDWVIIGGQSRTSGCPEMQPEWTWVEYLLNQARQHGCSIYFKPNLQIVPKEYPTGM